MEQPIKKNNFSYFARSRLRLRPQEIWERDYSPHAHVIIPASQITFISSCQIYTPRAILILLFLYVNLTMTMNPLSSKVHFLAQTRPKKRRTNRTGQTENQHERVNSAPKSRACADVIQLCLVVGLAVPQLHPHPININISF